MKRYFICLANSKKYGERCIAGIEVHRKTNGNFRAVRRADQSPKWIRPVTDTEMGQVPAHMVRYMRLLDIYQLEVLKDCPKSYQQENVLFRKYSLQKITTYPLQVEQLRAVCSTNNQGIFGNFGYRVSTGCAANLTHSLALIEAERAEVLRVVSPNSVTGIPRIQIRLQFEYQNTSYDFPITDLDFLHRYDEDADLLATAQHVFVCTSLGITYRDWHYKLAAGIIVV
ncbi:MAG: hypothetical protein AAGI49_07030 [Bacteroidota bacterium]